MTSMLPLRDVFFSDAHDPGTDIGGLMSTSSITNAVFHTIVAIVIGRHRDDDATFYIQTEDGDTLARDAHQTRPGRYLIQSDDPVAATTRRFFTRALSTSAATRLESFRREVRARDQGCVVTKVRNIQGPLHDFWVSFEAAHVVPVAYAAEWRRQDFGRLVTIPPPPPRHNDTINSVQNGLLMRSSIHQLFDAYSFSILPSAGYAFIFFRPDMDGLEGTGLDQQLIDDPRRPPDELLEWHFEQAVLCNVRGAGEPNQEFDFPPGSDMMGDILAGPKAGERMEFELFTRLGPGDDEA